MFQKKVSFSLAKKLYKSGQIKPHGNEKVKNFLSQ